MELLKGVHLFNIDPNRERLVVYDYLSPLDFFSMDVIITRDSFMVCEVNSAPSTFMGQFHRGKCCHDNEDARAFVKSQSRPCKKGFKEGFVAAIEEC